MNKQIETIRKTRTALLETISELNHEQLNKIPTGFNNNIIWNLAHLIAAQQGICYLKAGLPLVVDKEFFLAYKPDSKPEKFVETEDIEKIRALLFSTLDQLELDVQQNLFTYYRNWITRYGVEINNIEGAISFLPFHEGLHLGYIMALKRVVKNRE